MHILVAQPGGVGEAVYTTPIIVALQQAGYTVSAAVWSVSSLPAEILRLPKVRTVLPLSDRKRIADHAFDAIVLCSGYSEWHHLTELCPPKTFFAPPPIDSPKAGPVDRSCHVSQYFYSAISQLGITGQRPAPVIPDGEPVSVVGPRPKLGLCIGYMKKPKPKTEKHWGDRNFARLARWFVSSFGGGVFLLGDNLDQAANGASIERLSKEAARSYCGKYRPETILGVIHTLDLVVGNSTGLTHVSAAVGLPALEVWKSGAPQRRWGPIGPKASSVKCVGDMATRRFVRNWIGRQLQK